jgi:hypothetical protein
MVLPLFDTVAVLDDTGFPAFRYTVLTILGLTNVATAESMFPTPVTGTAFPSLALVYSRRSLDPSASTVSIVTWVVLAVACVTVMIWLLGAGGGSNVDLATLSTHLPTKGFGVSAEDATLISVIAVAAATVSTLINAIDFDRAIGTPSIVFIVFRPNRDVSVRLVRGMVKESRGQYSTRKM